MSEPVAAPAPVEEVMPTEAPVTTEPAPVSEPVAEPAPATVSHTLIILLPFSQDIILIVSCDDSQEEPKEETKEETKPDVCVLSV